MNKIKSLGKLLSFSSTITVIIFFTYYIIASIKLGEFASAKNDYNPFDNSFLYTTFSTIIDYLFGYLIFCTFIPYAILSFFIHSLRLNKAYYLNWLICALVLVYLMCSKNFGGWMFD
ncbi:MAG: hypothetical protein IPF63_14040 [Bacteroidetes bacterium]|jgi:hypothetical protein|nr:hypothetical protein [Bacteroidota bacterium]